MPIVDVNGLRMYYERRGTGPLVVLIPGLAGSVHDFGPMIDALAEHFDVLAIDNRGAGRTDKPDEPYTIEMMAEDTIGLLTSIGVEKAHVVGVSMGGRIAIELASRRPDLIDRLALVSTTAKVRQNLRRTFVMGLMSRLVQARGGEDKQPRYAFERQLAASGGYDGTGKLAGIQAPTMILHGRNDNTAQYDLAQALRDGIPGAELVTFAGGHMFFMMREKGRFTAELAGFLSG